MSYTVPLIFIFSLIFGGCQTSSPKTLDSLFSPESVYEYRFSPEQKLKVYELLSEIELKNGKMYDKDRFHSLNGLLQCDQDGSLKSCFVRGLLPGYPYLSPKVRLPQEYVSSIVTYFRLGRTDLKDVRTFLTDLRCDYLGPKSPPFGLTDVNCHISFPRTTSEVIIEGLAGKQLFNDLNLLSNQDSNVQLGFVKCLFRSSLSSSECKIISDNRGPKNQGGQSLAALDIEHTLLAPKISEKLATDIVNAMQQNWALSKRGNRHGFKIPEQTRASIRCEEKNINNRKSSFKIYYCRLVL